MLMQNKCKSHLPAFIPTEESGFRRQFIKMFNPSFQVGSAPCNSSYAFFSVSRKESIHAGDDNDASYYSLS